MEPMSPLTTSNTLYARIAILLLAVNCILNGYLIYSMMSLQLERTDSSLVTRVAKVKTK